MLKFLMLYIYMVTGGHQWEYKDIYLMSPTGLYGYLET